jgi:hypothetical protein
VEFEYPSIWVSYFVWKIANLGNSDTSTGACVVSGGHVPGKGRCRQHAAQDNELLSNGQHSALFLPLQTVRENQGRQTAKKVGKKSERRWRSFERFFVSFIFPRNNSRGKSCPRFSIVYSGINFLLLSCFEALGAHCCDLASGSIHLFQFV